MKTSCRNDASRPTAQLNVLITKEAARYWAKEIGSHIVTDDGNKLDWQMSNRQVLIKQPT